MKFDEKGVKKLVTDLGMTHEIGRTLEAGATYETVAEAIHEALQEMVSIIKYRGKYNLFDLVCRRYGLGYGKHYKTKQISEETGCCDSNLLRLERKVQSRVVEKELLTELTSNYEHSREFARYWYRQLSRTRAEIYNRIMERVMEDSN